MRITYDAHAGAAYIYLTDKTSESQTRCLDDDIYIDFDAQDRMVGIEVLDASRRLDLKCLRLVIEELGPPKVVDVAE